MQLYAWLFCMSFNESMAVQYMDKEADENYDISLQDFLPTIAICNNLTDVTELKYERCNNSTLWEIEFIQSTLEGDIQHIPSVLCNELFEEWSNISDKERD